MQSPILRCSFLQLDSRPSGPRALAFFFCGRRQVAASLTFAVWARIVQPGPGREILWSADLMLWEDELHDNGQPCPATFPGKLRCLQVQGRSQSAFSSAGDLFQGGALSVFGNTATGGTSLERKRIPLGPYRKPMPRVLWGS